ncbi:MAG TPA: aspartate aminotransferase family protein [Bacteroidia bacterium]|jgi:acetylornithine/N-succinyldiaminopimelate aminotransferase|nr:aspartate aminotransferase family protein [Bacteroidia bacterium]
MHLSNRQIFLQHVAQTSPAPLALEIVSAKGVYLKDINGKEYIDLISGISVSNIGHCHPAVVDAVKKQVETHMHLMVFGEYAQSPQVQLAKALTDLLPKNLNSVYFVNSGTEATEGALKLAKRFTGRSELISFKNSYHGSTQGALSVMGSEDFKTSFRPLLPGTKILNFNSEEDLKQITEKTACVIIEPVQGEAGVIAANKSFFKKLRECCNETKTLLIFDEIQTGFGRTGTLFAFEQYEVTPDILLLAKGMGGGMPIGAFVSSNEIMSCLTHNPVLGHITTFGGHPVCCAAALANLKVISENKLYLRAKEIETILKKELVHSKIKELRVCGALAAVDFGDEATNMQVIQKCVEAGIITDWFLFNAQSMRIAPPLVITNEELTKACEIILKSLS